MTPAGMIQAVVVVCLALLGLASTVEAKTQRSAKAKAEFRRFNPCPSTGEIRGRCPDYVIAPAEPLCDAGADTSGNMVSQSVTEAKRNDRAERVVCGVSGMGATHVMANREVVFDYGITSVMMRK